MIRCHSRRQPNRGSPLKTDKILSKKTGATAEDKARIIDYIAEDSPQAAIEQGDEIERQVERLLEHPRLGRPGRVRGTRELVINRTPLYRRLPGQPDRHHDTPRPAPVSYTHLTLPTKA